MSRSKRGGKARWEPFNGRRPGNEQWWAYPAFRGGKSRKSITHKRERQATKKECDDIQ